MPIHDKEEAIVRIRKALALALLLALLASCALASSDHVHMMIYAQDPVWTTGSGRVACTFYYRCSICGEELVFTDPEPALTGEKLATCETGGYAFFRAAGWNGYNFTNSYEYFRTLPLGHDWQENWECRVEDDHLTGGTVTSVCRRCGKTVSAEFSENEIRSETLKEAAPGAEGEQLCIVEFTSEGKEFYGEFKLAIPALPVPVETVEESAVEEAPSAELTQEPAETAETAETAEAEEASAEKAQEEEAPAEAAAETEQAENPEAETTPAPIETEGIEVIGPVAESEETAEEAEAETPSEETEAAEATEEAETAEETEEAKETIEEAPQETAEEAPQPGAPVLLASPEDAVVQVGGEARFTARAQDYGGITWRLVNPVDGTEVLCSQAATVFPGLKIPELHYNTITLRHIPVELNGWQIYVTYSNDKGKTASAPAAIILTDGAGVLLPRPVPPAGE